MKTHSHFGRVGSPCGDVDGHRAITRHFSLILGVKYIQLLARWEFKQGAYEEQALYGINEDRKLAFWSFTSDGKRSQGVLAEASDIHPQAICFEAQMPAGMARMVYFPDNSGEVIWVVETKTKKGWNRFMEHHYIRRKGLG